jgi:hypothetical protein
MPTEVVAQADAQLRSTLAMAIMRFQRVAKGTTYSGKSWDGFMPDETKAKIAAQAGDLVKATSEGRLSRALLAEVASFRHYLAMASVSRLAYLLKAVEAALKAQQTKLFMAGQAFGGGMLRAVLLFRTVMLVASVGAGLGAGLMFWLGWSNLLHSAAATLQRETPTQKRSQQR